MFAMRRRLVTRSPEVKPNPLLRVVRTMSPSRTSTLKPRWVSAWASNWARVVFPEALNPINQTQNAPLAAAGDSGASPEELCKSMFLTLAGWIGAQFDGGPPVLIIINYNWGWTGKKAPRNSWTPWPGPAMTDTPGSGTPEQKIESGKK